jgi:hypothetical protein
MVSFARCAARGTEKCLLDLEHGPMGGFLDGHLFHMERLSVMGLIAGQDDGCFDEGKLLGSAVDVLVRFEGDGSLEDMLIAFFILAERQDDVGMNRRRRHDGGEERSSDDSGCEIHV